MRIALVIMFLVTLAACHEPAAPAVERRAAAEGARLGAFRAASATAQNFTGDVVIESGALLFTKGAMLSTVTLPPRGPDEPTVKGGQSFAAEAVGSADLAIEPRRVLRQTLAQGAPSLCTDGGAPTYLALAYGQRATRVTVIMFEGADAPGPQAADSRVCATYGYAAPDGARTSQGVVL
jgi:hypothetical protein